MATVSTAPLQRPKKLVRYGKTTSRTTFSTTNASQWLEDDDDATPSQPRVKNRTPTVKESYTTHEERNTRREAVLKVKKQEVAKPFSKSTKPEKTTADLFDVPSSEDEARTEFVLTQVSPPRVIAKRGLVDDTVAKRAELAPWEQVRVSPLSKQQTVGKVRPEDRIKPDAALDSAHISGGRQASFRRVPNHTNTQEEAATPSQTARVISQPSSAAAGLAARRKQAGSTQTTTSNAMKPEIGSHKRAGGTADAAVAAPRKRSRRSPPEETNREDALTCDALLEPVSNILPPSAEVEVDVYAFPDDPAESVVSRPSSIADKPTASRIRRSPTSSSPLPTAKKGLSAPDRLKKMLPDDSPRIDAVSRSPIGLRSSPSTPRRTATVANVAPPSTPPALVDGSPQTALKAAGTLTPRQAQLWSQLLASDPPAPTPGSLAIKELTLSGQRRLPSAGVPRSRALCQSSSDVTGMDRRRTRLVDRLKASGPSSEDDSSDEDSDEEMEHVVTHAKIPLKKAAEPDEGIGRSVPRGLQSQGQSQSQSTAAEAGSRITYARTRSYLPEDNLEDGLIFDLPSVAPLQPSALSREPSKTNLGSHQSAFDLEDSDDETAPGRMRTIHELRAAGRNSRFMQETEGILEDIADHAASARSRRRGALMELATKLMDKGYVERFVGQGFEHKLVAEVAAKTEDPIADFVLAAAFAFLLAAEPNEHCVTSLQSGGVTGWLSAMLGNHTELGKLAKDRKSNMSKSAQGTLLDFAKSAQTQTSLWGELTPDSLTQRLVALRMLDLLIGRLRRLGDKTELLDGAQLGLILLPTMAEAYPASVDLSIAVSLLEAISSSAQTPVWPTDLLEQLATLLPSLSGSADTPTHTNFLALRLTLNITNDNTRNCDIFARGETVHYLLSSIKSGFATLDAPPSLANPSSSSSPSSSSDQQTALSYDLLVLALGSTINLFEHSARARSHALSPPQTLLTSLLTTLTTAQTHLSTASSLAASSHNVAIGYVAVALANLCQDAPARRYIASKLPGGGLGVLVEGVEEFVKHHQCADRELEGEGDGGGGGEFGGEEGREVWGGFTERLREVLGRLREVA